jgi:transposase
MSGLKTLRILRRNRRTSLDTFELVGCRLKTARAYHIRLAFQDLFTQPADQAEYYLNRWCFWATHSRIPQIIDSAKTIRRHQAPAGSVTDGG